MNVPMKRILGFLASLTLAASVGTSCQAAIMVSADDQSLTQSSSVITTEVEIYLDLTDVDNGGSINASNFQVGVQLSGANAGTDFSIAGVSDTMSAMHPQGRPLEAVSSTATTARGMTLNFFEDFFVLDDLAGLMKVELEIQPNVTGTFQLDILIGDPNTAILDAFPAGASPLAFSVDSSTITVSADPAVPEPGTVFCFILMGGLALIARRRFGPRAKRES